MVVGCLYKISGSSSHLPPFLLVLPPSSLSIQFFHSSNQLLTISSIYKTPPQKHLVPINMAWNPNQSNQSQFWDYFRSFDPAGADFVADLPPHTAPQDSALDVNDPWYGGPADFLVTRDLLEAGMPGVLAWIRASATPEPASLVPTSFRSE